MGEKKGFTLIEIIISIAVLSVVGGFILQMFIASANADNRARNVDTGINMAVAAIELFKAQPDVDNYLQCDFFKDCQIDLRDSEQISIYKYYDGLWSPVPAGDSEKEKARFLLVVELTVDTEANDTSVLSFKSGGDVKLDAGCMCRIETTVTDMAAAPERQTLVNLYAKKYFSF